MEGFDLPVEDAAQELIECYVEGADWLSSYEFSVPENTPEDIVTRVGRGIFWEKKWEIDSSVSTVIKVSDAMIDTDDDDDVDPESILYDTGSADIEVDGDFDDVWDDEDDL